MQHTPNSNRFKITIIGSTNSGKSSLLNAITEQEISIVSNIKGTTTDSVKKAMEFLPFGPVLFTDTAGFNDNSELGILRIGKTIKEIKNSDFLIYVINGNDFNMKLYKKNSFILKKYSIPYINVVTREEKLDSLKKEEINGLLKDCCFVNIKDRNSVLNFKELLLDKLNVLEEDPGLLDGISNYGDTILMVIPIDSEAPKGRLILPQVQLMRAALDKGVKIIICRDTELEEVMKKNEKEDISLVVTDSQIFKKVDQIVNNKFSLTSFSILFARQKGDLKKLILGIKKIKNLNNGAQILISENCTHNTSHEDIGRVKIPELLQKKTGKKFNFNFSIGKDFPKDLKKYDLVIHCGACMITKNNMEKRINECIKEGVEITNYGLILAYLDDIFEKSIASILKANNKYTEMN